LRLKIACLGLFYTIFFENWQLKDATNVENCDSLANGNRYDMKGKTPKNIAAAVRQRLLNKARHDKRPSPVIANKGDGNF
jgi:hypothetical protein